MNQRAKKAACGRGDCGVSTGIHGGLTFGFGELDFNGYWEEECRPCTERERNTERIDELEGYSVIKTIVVTVESYEDAFVVKWGADVNLEASGDTREEAIENLKDYIVDVANFLYRHDDSKLSTELQKVKAIIKETLDPVSVTLDI